MKLDTPFPPTSSERGHLRLLTLLLGEKVSQLVPDVMSFSTSHETASL
nr:hypothetical protein [Candidatus Microthrix sp.]